MKFSSHTFIYIFAPSLRIWLVLKCGTKMGKNLIRQRSWHRSVAVGNDNETLIQVLPDERKTKNHEKKSVFTNDCHHGNNGIYSIELR